MERARKQSIPQFETESFAPGRQVEQARPGDFLLTHAKGLSSRLIRFGEALRYRGSRRPFAHWSHAALFVGENGDLIEAVESGVQKRNVSVYRGTEYHVVRLTEATDNDRQHAVAFAEHCLRESYGYVTDLSLALGLLTASRFYFGMDGQTICSVLVARALERVGAIFRFDPWNMLPADLAEAFQVVAAPGASTGVVPDVKTGVIARSR